MNKITKSTGRAYWPAITKLACCNIDLKKTQLFKTLMVLLVVVSTSTSMFAQQRTAQNMCFDERVGPTAESMMGSFGKVDCDGTLSIERVEQIVSSDDCDWRVIYEYLLYCENDGKKDQIGATKVVVFGGDTTAPELVIPKDVTVECDNVPEVGTPTASDRCNDNVEIIYEGQAILDDGDNCESSYIIERTWTAVDNCNEELNVTLTQTITVKDTKGPKLKKGAELPKGEMGVDVCYDKIPQGPSIIDIIALYSDNCGDVLVEKVPVFKGSDCSWKGYINYYVTDSCGNSGDTISLYYSGGDKSAPEFVNPPAAEITVTCVDLIPANSKLEWIDNCSVSDPKAKGFGVDDLSGLGADCEGGTMTRTWRAEDACGNKVVFVQTITVEPAPAVVFGEIEDMDIRCEDLANFTAGTIAYSNGGSGACDINGTIQGVAEEFKANCGSFTVTYKYSDACNSFEHVQTITVIDDVPPTIEGVDDSFSVECPDSYEFSTPTASDNCDNDVTLTFKDENNIGDCGLGSITRTWTATDNCENSATASQTITIKDETDPVFSSLPADVTEQCDAVTDAAVLTATDTCDTDIKVIFNEEVIPGDCTESYTIVRTWTAEDCAGNDIEWVQTVTVVDTEAPIENELFNLPVSDTEMEGCADDTPPLTEEEFAAMFTDNCSGVKVSLFTSMVGNDCEWKVIHIYSVMDNCGNETEDYKVIYGGEDKTAPVLTGVPADMAYDCGDDILDAPNVTASDLCAGDLDVEFNESIDTPKESCPGTYTITRTWSAVDTCGNPVSATQVITVTDTTAPVQILDTPKGDNELYDTCMPKGDEVYDLPNFPTDESIRALFADDDCSGVYVSHEVDITGTDCKWILDVKFTIVDGCGNAAEPIFLYYHGGDQVAPELVLGDNGEAVCANENMLINTSATGVCPADATISVNIGDEITSTSGIWSVAGMDMTHENLKPCFMDNCTDQDDLVFTVVGTNDGDKDTCSRIMSVTFDVSDSCGNTYPDFVCTFIIVDDVAPVITEAIDAPVECDGTDQLAAWLANNGGNTAVDCNDVTWTNDYGTCDQEFTNRLLTSEADFSGAETFINFDDIDAGTDAGDYVTLGNEYQSLGLTFSGDKEVGINTYGSLGAITPISSPNNLSPYDGTYQNEFGNITLSFESGINRVGFYLGTNDSDDVEVTVSCISNGVVMATEVFTTGMSTQFFGLESAVSFDQLLFDGFGPTNSFVWIDDLRFEGCEGSTSEDENECSSSTTVTFTATDACGLSTSTTSTFTVEDTTGPVFTDADCDTTVELDFDPNNGPGEKDGFTMLGEYNGHTYYITNETMTAYAGNTLVGNNGGYMATLSDDAENQWVYDAAVASNDGNNIRFWIGLTDEADEGNYVWMDGTPLDYTNWANGEPNNVGSGGEDCVELGRYASAQWNDEPCTNMKYILMEVDGITLKEEAKYTDACAGDGTVTDYTDSDVTYIGTDVNVSINLGVADGPVSNGRPGYVGIAVDGNSNQVGDSTYELYWTDHSDWHLKEIAQGGQETYLGYTWIDGPSCDFNDWGEYSILTGVICDENGLTMTATIGTTENSFTRTFTANDGCDNVSECVVTYTWAESDEITERSTITNDGADYVHEGAQAALVQIDGMEMELDFAAYPVPFDSDVNVKFNFEFDTDVTINVHDTRGLLIKSLSLTNVRAGSDVKKSFDLSRAGDQLFYITVITNQGSVTKKVVSSNIKR